MSPSNLNFWLFTAGCIILAWTIRAGFAYVHEMKEMVADIWWNSEKAAMLQKVQEAEKLVTPDRPFPDLWTIQARIQLKQIIKEIEQGNK